MTTNNTGKARPTFPTPACILRAAAAYVIDHGVHQPVLVGGELCHVDRSTDPITPAASPEGAIRMVVFGRPILDDCAGPDRDLYAQALKYLRLEEDAMPVSAGLTVDGAASLLLWASLAWDLDQLSCPGCLGPVCGLPNPGAVARAVIPVYRHFPSLTPMCGDAIGRALPVYHQGDHGNG